MRTLFFTIISCCFLISACNGETQNQAEKPGPEDQTVEQVQEKQLTPFQPLAKELIVSGVNDHWTLTVTSDGTSSFRSFELNKLFPEVSFGENNGQVILSNDNEEVVVVITKEECQRNPSSPVSMLTSEFSMEGRSFKGCATWKKDTRLFGEWKLASFQGETLQDTSEYSGTPFMVVNHKGISGRAGCNQFNANYYTVQDKWFMEPNFMTKASCPRMALEQSLMNFLSDQNTSFSVNEEELTITNQSSLSATFKKIEQ